MYKAGISLESQLVLSKTLSSSLLIWRLQFMHQGLWSGEHSQQGCTLLSPRAGALIHVRQATQPFTYQPVIAQQSKGLRHQLSTAATSHIHSRKVLYRLNLLRGYVSAHSKLSLLLQSFLPSIVVHQHHCALYGTYSLFKQCACRHAAQALDSQAALCNNGRSDGQEICNRCMLQGR